MLEVVVVAPQTNFFGGGAEIFFFDSVIVRFTPIILPPAFLLSFLFSISPFFPPSFLNFLSLPLSYFPSLSLEFDSKAISGLKWSL